MNLQRPRKFAKHAEFIRTSAAIVATRIMSPSAEKVECLSKNGDREPKCKATIVMRWIISDSYKLQYCCNATEAVMMAQALLLPRPAMGGGATFTHLYLLYCTVESAYHNDVEGMSQPPETF